MVKSLSYSKSDNSEQSFPFVVISYLVISYLVISYIFP